MIITRAAEADIPAVLALLNDAAKRLHARGITQWPNDPHFTPARIEPLLGDVYLAWDEDVPVATITVQAGGDPDFWTPRELAVPASYLSKMARAEGYPGIGGDLLRWAVNAAHERGDRWVRLDAWRTNLGLHAYYIERGWAYVRTVEAPRRNSGALFQRLALPVSFTSFTSAPSLPERPAVSRRVLGILQPGAVVVTSGRQRGVVTEVIWEGVNRGIVSADWEYGTGRAPVHYRVHLDSGRTVILSEADVTEAASVSAAAHV